MDKFETIAQAYAHALATNNYDAITSLFADDGVVNSPVYGNMTARAFYENLFKKNIYSDIRVKNIFRESNDPHIIALHLFLKAKVPDVQVNDCIDILKVNDAGKISSLTIIFDTFPVRGALKK